MLKVKVGTYKRGSKGPAVEALQKALNDLKSKPQLNPDGMFGGQTKKSVEFFQKKVGLKVDGIAGKSTVGAINSGGKSGGGTGVGGKDSGRAGSGGKPPKMDVEDYARLKTQADKSHKKYEGELKEALQSTEAIANRSESKKYENAISKSWNNYTKAYKDWVSLADKVVAAQKKFKSYGKTDEAAANLWLEHAQKVHTDAIKQSKTMTASIDQMQKIIAGVQKQTRSTPRR